MKHTPGPWIVCTNSEDNRLSIEQDFENLPEGYSDPTIIVDCVDDMGQNLDRPTAEANARIMAAAPDLLNALSELHGEFMSRMSGVRDRDWTPEEIKAEEQARLAMGKVMFA
jgi:hypothetical protein